MSELDYEIQYVAAVSDEPIPGIRSYRLYGPYATSFECLEALERNGIVATPTRNIGHMAVRSEPAMKLELARLEIPKGDVTMKLACSECGSKDLWAWYPQYERQSITVWLEGSEVKYDYTGSIAGSSDAGEDDEYYCAGCMRTAATVEELVGQPVSRQPLADKAALDDINLLLSASEWPGASGMEDVCAIVRRTGRSEIPNAPEWERH